MRLIDAVSRMGGGMGGYGPEDDMAGMGAYGGGGGRNVVVEVGMLWWR